MRFLTALLWLYPSLAFAFGTPKPLPVADNLSTLPQVCYSVRVLENSGYGQPILYERRSSDNTVRAIYYQPNGMLDQWDALAFAGSGSAYVTQWNSNCAPRIAATGAYDTTQTTAANQPQIVASGVLITANGVPTLKFASAQLNSNNGISNSSVYTVLNVISIPVTPVESANISQAYNSSPAYLFVTSSLALSQYPNGTAGGANSPSNTFTVGQLFMAASFGSTTVNPKLYFNGNSVGTGTPGTISASTGFEISYSGTPTIEASEIIQFNGQYLSTADKSTYDLNTAAAFGITGVTQ